LKIASVPHDNIAAYTFEDGRHITATDDHPLLTTHGWASSNPAKTAAYKGLGKIYTINDYDEIITADGTVKIAAISRPRQKIMTYTIVKLAEGNIFFANGLAVGTEDTK
jgi:intein/homing endonuclease